MTTTMQLTHFQFDIDPDGVATVLIDRAGEAMNTLSPDLSADLEAIIDRLEQDDVKAVVLGSAKPDNFLAGADIRWFLTLTDTTTATQALLDAQEGFNRLERLHTVHGKPVVAAIHGPCLGGGLELALACSMRICSDDEKRTQLGQPEIQLGILPAGGGTQRLPRLIGIASALDLILTGRSIRPRRALKMGLVDEVCPKEVLLEVAKKRALEAATAPAEASAGGLDRVKSFLAPSHLQQLALEENPLGRRVLFQKAEEQMLAETKGNYPAPKEALACVKIGVEKGMEAGLRAEAEAFGRLVVTPEARALISLFFAQQELKKDRGVDSDVEAATVHKVGVIGGGLMGGGIAAINVTRAHTTTRIKEVDDAGVGRGLAYVQKVVDGLAKRRRISPHEAGKLMRTVTGTTDYSGFSNVDLVIEAVFEDLELKRSVLQDVEAVTGDRAIFASNTSSIPIAHIAEAAGRPENVIGMHYFSPVEKMPLLEIIVTDQTADWVTATCVDFGKKQGKTVIVVNDGPGFYTSRIIGPYMNEVGHLLSEGVPIDAIDAAMEQWGFPVGPVVLMDEVGIDVGAKVAKVMQEALGDRVRPPELFGRLIEDGRLGRKNGRGFYRYEKGKKDGVDETVYEVLGVTPSNRLPAGQIQDRLSLAMINEAALCLEEGILRSARDGDIGAVFGLGFPPFTGGPFTLIDRLGAKEVVARLDRLADQHGDRFTAAEILRDHAETGTTFR